MTLPSFCEAIVGAGAAGSVAAEEGAAAFVVAAQTAEAELHAHLAAQCLVDQAMADQAMAEEQSSPIAKCAAACLGGTDAARFEAAVGARVAAA